MVRHTASLPDLIAMLKRRSSKGMSRRTFVSPAANGIQLRGRPCRIQCGGEREAAIQRNRPTQGT
jgi:hypothetical protein